MNPKKILSNNLQSLLDRRGITQTKMANDLGFPEMTVSNWMKEKTYPRVDRLQQMADYFGVYRSDITDEKKQNTKAFSSNQYDYYPTSISAGITTVAESVAEYETEKLEIPDYLMGKHAGNNDIYVTRVNGESMNKVIPNGSFIAVKPVELSCLHDGDIVVFKYDNETAVKRYYNHGDKIAFRPDSTDSSFFDKVIDINDGIELKIKGKVVLYIVDTD